VEELISIVQSLDGNTTKEEIQEMLTKVDIDGKGSVNFEEFLNVIGMTMKVIILLKKICHY